MPTPEVFNKTAILKTYRQLLRATYIAFKGKSTALRSIIILITNNTRYRRPEYLDRFTKIRARLLRPLPESRARLRTSRRRRQACAIRHKDSEGKRGTGQARGRGRALQAKHSRAHGARRQCDCEEDAG